MKTRSGFVSNSSSSSFIIALAKVIDKSKLEGWLKSVANSEQLRYDVEIKRLGDIPVEGSEEAKYECTERVKDSTVIRTTLLNDDFTVELDSKNLSEDDEILIVTITNDEGDYDFYPPGAYERYKACWEEVDFDNEDDPKGDDLEKYIPYPDWDIDINFVVGWQQKLWHGLNDKESFTGLDNINCRFGAGRNG